MNGRFLVLIAAWLVFLAPARAPIMAGQDPKPAAPAPAPVPAAAEVVVAKVLGESVTEKQILATIDQIARTQQATQQQLQTKNTAYFKDALDTLIGGILLKNEAKEKNVTADKAKVEETLKSLKGQFASEGLYQQALQQQGMKEEDVIRSVETNLVYQMVLEAALKDLPVPTDAEMMKFYQENPKYFLEPEQVHAAHIFLKADKSATQEQKDEARKRLEAVRADIESKKATFAESAKISDDKATAGKDGDLGFFKRGDMLKPIEDAAFGAKPGALVPVVETEFGFHLIQVIEFKPESAVPLDKVKPDIKSYLERKAKQEATKKHIDELKGKTTIEMVMTEAEWMKRYTVK